MRKNVFGRRLKRDANERKSLFKSLMTSLVLDEKIKTTEAKAKSIRSKIDKLVTKAKKREDEARRFLSPYLMPNAIDKMIDRIAPQFKNRPGGYTRIIRLGNRLTDSASMVVMEWTEVIKAPVSAETKSKKTSVKKKNAKPKAPVKTSSKKVINTKTKAKVSSKTKKK